MKKICFLVESIFTIGGVQRVTAVIAKALAKNCDVTIITLDAPSKQDTSLYGLDETDIHFIYLHFYIPPRLKNTLCRAYSALYRKVLYRTGRKQGSLIHRCASDLYARSSFPSQQRKQLTDILVPGGFDTVIGVHAPLAVRLAACKKTLGKTRLVGWIHNSYEALFGEKSLYIGAERRMHYEQQLAKLDSTVVLCQYDARKYHFPTHVIYNPLTLLPGQRSRGTSRKFLAVGRFSRQHKGFDLLIDAFNIFAKENAEWTLDIVGEGPEEQLYRQKIAQYALERRVHLYPFTTNIQQYYSQAQVYVLSSRWEGFGLVLVEAMSHGLPVVSSDLPTSLEIMGDFGIYFKNGDVSQLAKSLHEATQLDWTAKSVEAIQIARRFDVGAIIEQWTDVLDIER